METNRMRVGICIGLLTVVALVVVGYPWMRLRTTYLEYENWRSREAVLREEVRKLKEENAQHRQFLDRLSREPAFQEAVARKEIGFGKPGEHLYHFSEEKKDKGDEAP